MLMRTKRDYLTLRGLSRQELDMLLDRSLRFKESRRRVRRDDVLAGKAIANGVRKAKPKDSGELRDRRSGA